MPPAAVILHALASTTTDPASLVSYILNLGVLGLVLLDAGVTRKLFAFALLLKREEKERERERAAYEERIAAKDAVITKLTELAEEQMIPALTRATDVNKDYVRLLQDSQRRRRDE